MRLALLLLGMLFLSIPAYPQTVLELNQLAVNRLSESKYEEALRLLDKAIRKQPRYVFSYVNRARTYVNMSAGNFSSSPNKRTPNFVILALQDLDYAIKLDPMNYHLYLMRGNCRGMVKQYQSALDDFNRAIELSPDSPEGYFGRSNIRKQMNDREGAAEDMEKGYRLSDPRNVQRTMNFD